MHLHLTLDALASMKERDDPYSYAQAHLFLALTYGYAHSMSLGKRYLKKAVEIIRRNRLRFVPISDGDVAQSQEEDTESLYERVTVLAQMVYVGIITYLVGQYPSPIMGYDNTGQSELSVSGCYALFATSD